MSIKYNTRLEGPLIKLTKLTKVEPMLSIAWTVLFVTSVAPCAISLKMFEAALVAVSTASPMAVAMPFNVSSSNRSIIR